MPIDPNERPSRVPWPPILLAALIAAGWALGRGRPLAWPEIGGALTDTVGWGLLAAGLALLAWSAATILGSGTTVRPNAGVTNLVIAGPYRHSRNPMYLSEVVMLAGLAAVTRNAWFAAAAIAFASLVTKLAIVPEERHLEARFGNDYRAYKAHTRRWI
jgi:protein-S-isoprenylcysteine O-methyltransferase Ste14